MFFPDLTQLLDSSLRETPSLLRKSLSHWIPSWQVGCWLTLLSLWYMLLQPYMIFITIMLNTLKLWCRTVRTTYIKSRTHLTKFYFSFVHFLFPLYCTAVPQPGRHRKPMTAPKTQTDKVFMRKKTWLTILTVVLILGILATAAYFGEPDSNSFYILITKDRFPHIWKTCK